MARIAGVDLPREKRVEVGLTYIYGIGPSTAKKILAATNIDPDTRVKDLTAEQEGLIREYLDKNNVIVEGDLRRGAGHQAPGGGPVLPRCSPSQGAARSRPAHQDQRSHPQGPEAHRREQEEVRRSKRNGN